MPAVDLRNKVVHAVTYTALTRQDGEAAIDLAGVAAWTSLIETEMGDLTSRYDPRGGGGVFEHGADYPTAVASRDDAGEQAAIQWTLGHLKQGETLFVWTSLKSNLRNSTRLSDLVSRYSNVEHVTGRGTSFVQNGPVLMAWPDLDDIGKLMHSKVAALCVITWVDDWIRPWVTAVQPEILGDGTAWEKKTPDLNPVVVEALKSMTSTVNHNNTISAGYEKDAVVGILLALNDARVPMNAEAMQGWAIANGWSGDNPKRLARYVNDIKAGKRPQTRSPRRADFVERMRARAEGREE